MATELPCALHDHGIPKGKLLALVKANGGNDVMSGGGVNSRT